MIAIALQWYLRYGLSYRDVEELLTERGVEVDHVTIYRGCRRIAISPNLAQQPLRAPDREGHMVSWAAGRRGQA